MTPTSSPPRWNESLERFLRSLAANKAAMSDLRTGRNKNPEECRRLHRWVSPFVEDRHVNTGHERAVYTVAALFAGNPDLKPIDHGLGASLAELRRSARFSDTGLESRLIRLCRSATSQELCRNLAPVVSLLAAASIPISWASLAADIDAWDFRPDAISRRWLRDFYTDRPNTDTDTDSTDTDATDTPDTDTDTDNTDKES